MFLFVGPASSVGGSSHKRLFYCWWTTNCSRPLPPCFLSLHLELKQKTNIHYRICIFNAGSPPPPGLLSVLFLHNNEFVILLEMTRHSRKQPNRVDFIYESHRFLSRCLVFAVEGTLIHFVLPSPSVSVERRCFTEHLGFSGWSLAAFLCLYFLPVSSRWAAHMWAFRENWWVAACDTWLTWGTEKCPLCLLRRGTQPGDRKGFDHQICPPWREKTPSSVNTLRHSLVSSVLWPLGMI